MLSGKLTVGCDITGLHGPMLERRLASGAAGYDERSFLALVSNSGVELAPEGLDVLHPGQVQGPMFGGTIAQLVASLGTPFAFSPPEGCCFSRTSMSVRIGSTAC